MMKKTATFLWALLSSTFLFNVSAQDIYYGDDYIVFEAEATTSSLDKWTLLKPGDAEYQKYVTNDTGVDPIFDTYLQYTGGWQASSSIAENSRLEYQFTCPKTGTYRLLIRMHQPLEVGEAGDQKNDVFVKMAGNFTSETTGKTVEQLKQDHKFWGRGVNKWGSCHKLEISNHVDALYGFTEGEEYTFTMSGRSDKTCIDYILFYDVTTQPEIPQGDDVATFFPPEYRPGLNLVDPVSVAMDADSFDLRVGTEMPLALTWDPVNSKKEINWNTSNDTVVTVDENGMLTAVGELGEEVVITATSAVNGVADSCVVTLVDWYAVEVENIRLSADKEIISEGSTLQIMANFMPSYADNQELIWSSSDTALAVVDSKGLMTAKAEGKVNIRATSVTDETVYGDIEIGIAQLVSASMAYDDESKYKTTAYVVGEMLPVSIDYHAGTFNTVKEVKLWLRHMNSSWSVQKDYLQTIPDGIVGSESGTLKVDIDLTGVTPSADLPDGDFYFLFAKFTMSDGTVLNKGLNPINIVAPASALYENQVMETLLYPNPANDFVSIDIQDNAFVSVYNASGKRILCQRLMSKEPMDVSTFEKGIYFVKIEAENIHRVEKLIIK